MVTTATTVSENPKTKQLFTTPMVDELIIEPGRTERNYWRDLWRFRELLYFLAQRDVLVRYKQTVIGAAWALIRPALTMAIFVAFRRMTKLPSTVVPDVLLVFAALLPWQFFSTSLTESSNSLIGNANLISKVYFPRLLVPAAAVVTSLMDFAVTLGLLALLMLWYQFAPGPQMLFLPALVLLTFALSVGTGLLLAALNVEYRDFRYVVPFIVQFGLFVSPIAIQTKTVPQPWRFALSLNPMTGIIDAFRWAILAGRTPLDLTTLSLSVAVTLLFLTLGIWYFRRTERGFADVI
jgi:lipopolysaccharide transport system permease protein